MLRQGVKSGENPERLRRERDFHKRLTEDMLRGLRAIYKEIAQLATGQDNRVTQDSAPSAADTAGIFHEASRQLEDVMATTLRAADDIMTKAESIQSSQAELKEILKRLHSLGHAPEDVRRAMELLSSDSDSVTSIVTALSFQDLTGQRIKKVVSALGSVRDIVLQTYVSAGLMLKQSAADPEKDLELIAAESKKDAAATVEKGAKLKGPDLNASQKDVDDLLSQLGF